jgi:hypothetical protein
MARLAATLAAESEQPMTSLRFRRALDELDVWSATSGRYSFVITYGSPNGPGFKGSPGYLATWRPLHPNGFAIKIAGSPFRMFANAAEACNTMLMMLNEHR